MKERYLKDSGEVLYLYSGNTDAIKAAQNFFNEFGYTDGHGEVLAVDGDYGKNTYNAVIKYQRDNGLTVDGKIGDETWNHMWDNFEKKYSESEQKSYETVKKNRAYDTGFGDFVNAVVDYSGATKKLKQSGGAYSPDGSVEKAENDNALRNREEPITGVDNPYDMASYASRHLDGLEWIYQKSRLSNNK